MREKTYHLYLNEEERSRVIDIFCSLIVNKEKEKMAVERRKDSKRRVLKEGEYERPNGTYEFRWRDKTGKRRTVYGKTLEDLREKETDVLRDMLDGINPDSKNMTINDLYCRWKQVKHGLGSIPKFV